MRTDMAPDPADHEMVTRLLGRRPMGDYAVVVRRVESREPVVIRNAPALADGTPMPTRYWLVGDRERARIGRLEAAGGVRRAEEEVDAVDLEAAHQRYARQRDRAADLADPGPRAFGGVGGTRRGVKCLHAHYAWWLAGGDDPVGRWTHRQLMADPVGGS